MRITWISLCALLCAAVSALALEPLVLEPLALEPLAAEPLAEDGSSVPAGFPAFSREDVVRVCLSEYGMGNSSVLDCLAQDQKVRAALARKWADIDGGFKTACVTRLANLGAQSYSHLDACVRSAEKAKDATAPE